MSTHQQDHHRHVTHIHLFILQHGLWGRAACVSRLEQYLRQKLSASHACPDTPPTEQGGLEREATHIVNSTVNEGKLTYDGG